MNKFNELTEGPSVTTIAAMPSFLGEEQCHTNARLVCLPQSLSSRVLGVLLACAIGATLGVLLAIELT
jgi:hypothetical protein